MPVRRTLKLSLPVVATTWLAAGAGLAWGEEVLPYAAHNISLESARGTIYFTSNGGEDEVVTTLNSDTHALRFVVSLRPGQSEELSTPVSIGEPTTVIEVRREGDKIFVFDHPRATDHGVGPMDTDFMTGP
jgi:hypothetical protein